MRIRYATARLAVGMAIVAWTVTSAALARQDATITADYVATDLGTLGGAERLANDINGAGQIVEMAETAEGVPHAFVWDDGTMTDLGTLGRVQGMAHGINEMGEVVGQDETAEGAPHAVLWSR